MAARASIWRTPMPCFGLFLVRHFIGIEIGAPDFDPNNAVLLDNLMRKWWIAKIRMRDTNDQFRLTSEHSIRQSSCKQTLKRRE